ncbi:flagellar hook-length control protein FliK [Phenylobacterium sp.]|uniref:flagellar hook-length control protein FliK n=1 Tax=Phenylobacterium sp. TaxID=1871053 RepID=UPI00286A8D2A|nr:flagellar hook-length control protein FliK [Phenylobacterium sp.]
MTIAPISGVSQPNLTIAVTPVRAVSATAPAMTPLPDLNPAQIQALAVAEVTRAAAARQGGLAPLVADLAQAAQEQALPNPVRDAAARVLAHAPPLTGNVTGPDVAKAMARSGLFLEANLAAAPMASPVGQDLKAGLLILRQALSSWLAAAPAAQGARTGAVPPPPYRAGGTRAQPPAVSKLSPGGSPVVMGQELARETDAALGRQELLQLASLPVQSGPEAQVSRWMFEMPFVTPQGAGVAQFEVSRDGRAESGEAEPVWRAAFSLDAEPLGPIHARVGLSGGQAIVSLWAERAHGLDRLRADQGLLTAALAAVQLRAEVAIHPGTPPNRIPEAGRLVDQTS